MGQYHKTYNLDKREFINPHRVNSGAKLLEQIGWARSVSSALFLLLANSNGRGGGDAPFHALVGHWAGDRILVQGDYAEPGDTAYVSDDELSEFTDISGQVLDMLQACVDEE